MQNTVKTKCYGILLNLTSNIQHRILNAVLLLIRWSEVASLFDVQRSTFDVHLIYGLQYYKLVAAIWLLTALSETSISSFSSAVSLNSTIRSTPPLPRTTGTPRKQPEKPNSPSR